MSNRVINVDVSDSYISITGDTAGASGAMKATTMRMTFDDHWAGTSKTIYFTDALGEASVSVLLSADALVDGTAATYDVPIPAEAMTAEGLASVTVCGIALAADNVTVIRKITTKAAKFRVMDSEIPSSASNEATVTATDKQQMQSALDAVVSGESGRVAAEAARVEAENARQNIETGYVAQATAQANAAAESARLAAQVVLGQIQDGSLTEAKLVAEVQAAIDRAKAGGAIDLSLSNKAEFDDGFLTSGSIKSWAESKSIHTSTAVNTFVTDLPYAGYWGVNFYFYPSGTWRVLIATDIQCNKQYFIVKNAELPWSEWQQIATATPPTEYDLPLESGWSAARLKYLKTQDGMVTLDGYEITSGSTGTGAWKIATLPAGHRPGNAVFAVVTNYTTGAMTTVSELIIDQDGNVFLHRTDTSATKHAVCVTFKAVT